MLINFETSRKNREIEKSSAEIGIKTDNPVGKTNNCAYKPGEELLPVDNCAYEDCSMKIADIQDLFGGELDVDVQRKMMTVMSNCMSEEDYQKAMEDGFSPADMEPEKLVTIVDHIKTEMAKAGKVVAGYNDSLDEETLKEIVGDTGQARQIKNALEENDLPCSAENVKELKETVDKAKEISELDDGSKKYIIENNMELSVDSLYKANFSAFGNGNKQGKGYFSQECNGYFAEKASKVDWKKITPQLKAVISGMEDLKGTPSEQLEDAKWLVEKGIPVERQAMSCLQALKEIKFPLLAKDVIETAVSAMVQGKKPGAGILTGSRENIYSRASELSETVQTLTENSAAVCIQEKQKLHIANLIEAQDRFASMKQDEQKAVQQWINNEENAYAEGGTEGAFVRAKRQLLEVQLSMTAKANVQLIKAGIKIETTGLAELVELLKKQEEATEKNLFQNEEFRFVKGEEKILPGQSLRLFYETAKIVREIPSMPAEVAGKMSESENATLTEVHDLGEKLKARYDAAEKRYETVMTKPRADLGDRIKDAFRNSDDILEDLNLERNEDNRKCLRILSYNQMELNRENLFQVKELYLQLENIVKSLTPDKTLQLIREGINPLAVTMDELEKKLLSMENHEEENKKFSRFLYELDQKKEITDAERESYIGIYRYFRQLEKTDDAAIGGILSAGAEHTLGNMLTAMRSRKSENRSYRVDDSFGGVAAAASGKKSISEQIEAGVMEARLFHAVYRDLSVEGLEKISDLENATLSDLRDVLQGENSPSVSQNEISDEEKKMEAAIKEGNQIFSAAEKFKVPASAENILATENLFSFNENVFNVFEQISERFKKEKSSLHKKTDSIIENFNNRQMIQESLENLTSDLEDSLITMSRNDAEEIIDLKQMQSCFKQLSVIGVMRRQESYHIPLQTGDGFTAVHLTFLQEAEEKGTVKISTDSEIFGKVTVKYQLNGDNLYSFGMYEKKEKAGLINDFSIKVAEQLKQKGFQIKEQHFVESLKDLDLLTFSLGDVDNNSRQETNERLYQIAKVFLQEIRKES